MIKKLLLTLIVAITVSNLFSQGIIISEVADGTGSGGYPKYVELTNTTASDFDLDGYKIRKGVNGGALSDAYVFTGTLLLPAGESIVITNMDNITSGHMWADFGLATPVNIIEDISAIDCNGDDSYVFANASDNIIDIYGVELIDGTGENWEYLDSYAYRNSSVLTPNATFDILEWTVIGKNFLDTVTDMSTYLTPGTHNTTPPSVTDAYILDFTFVEETGAATIDPLAGTVHITVLNGSPLGSLTPTITLSTGATINPNSGVAQDFSTPPFNYIATAVNGTTTKSWDIYVSEAPASSDAIIETFVLAEQTGPAVINASTNTITIEVINGTPITALTPTITVSAGASINPLSGTPQNFTGGFTYTVTAQNLSTVDWDITVNVAASTPVVTIYDIQGQTAVSPYDTLQVITSGIVTAVSSSGYWIQDGAGAWNGIYVYDNVNIPTIGDDVTIEGKVAEYFDLTQVKDITSFTINSSSNTLPAAEVLTTAACSDEAYESVFVQTLDANCINEDAGYGIWTINNGANASDSLQIDDVIFHYTATLGENYNVQGVLYYSYGAFKIFPRENNDIFVIINVEQNENTEFSVYPNPAIEEINLDNIKNIDYVTLSDINGTEITKINVTSENVKINTSCLKAGMYVISAFDKKGNLSTVKFIKK